VRVFGIIGRPLGHSLSQAYFEEKFSALGLSDYRFLKFQLESIGELDEVLSEYGDELKGFCVTIPYKREIIARLDEISPEALEIGAVNCVRMREGHLAGYNTDAHGFRVGLDQLLGDERPRALVLGTGGASCAVRWVLESAGIEYRMVSRNGGEGFLTYDGLTPEIIEAYRLIVNTTPLGTSPAVEGKPLLPYRAIGERHYLYDLVYNPPLTAFLTEGQRRGARTLNGEVMFRAQAEKNWEIWNDLEI
jgi:shikimate dehydrogenase